jgi:hypothetical protein
MTAWQSLQDRPIMNFSEPPSLPYGLEGCWGYVWHCWQSRGLASFSSAS